MILLVLVLGLLAFALTIVLLARPFAIPSDIEGTVAAAVNYSVSPQFQDAKLASEICDKPVRGLRCPTLEPERMKKDDWDAWIRMKVSLEALVPLLPREGRAVARVSGVGVGANEEVVTGICTARVAFSYRCRWEDSGRANVFRCSITEGPIVLR